MNSEYFIKTIRELKKDIIKITGNPVVLVADNASYHTSEDTTKYQKSIRFKKLDWLAWSPGLNPIENVWGWIKNELSKEDIATEEDLKERVKNLWDSISKEYIEILIKSMKGKFFECIEKMEIK